MEILTGRSVCLFVCLFEGGEIRRVAHGGAIVDKERLEVLVEGGRVRSFEDVWVLMRNILGGCS
jgi:hypothetical protein